MYIHIYIHVYIYTYPYLSMYMCMYICIHLHIFYMYVFTWNLPSNFVRELAFVRPSVACNSDTSIERCVFKTVWYDNHLPSAERIMTSAPWGCVPLGSAFFLSFFLSYAHSCPGHSQVCRRTVWTDLSLVPRPHAVLVSLSYEHALSLITGAGLYVSTSTMGGKSTKETGNACDDARIYCTPQPPRDATVATWYLASTNTTPPLLENRMSGNSTLQKNIKK